MVAGFYAGNGEKNSPASGKGDRGILFFPGLTQSAKGA